MKKIIVPIIAGFFLMNAVSVQAQSLSDILNGIKKQTGSSSSSTGSTSSSGLGGNLSNTDIASGLKEALKIGAQNASGKLSATDGFFKNAALKILLPAEAKQVESTLRSIGMGSVVDKAVLSMNRAAEDAAKQAAPIFINAITSISIQDGLNILRGGNNAATNFLKSKTTSALTSAFKPVIQKSLNKVGAPTVWNSVFSTYNKLPLSKNKINPDLTGYVTERALSGLFTTIAEEESKIRNNPAAQVTSLLQKVFGKK